MVRGNYNTKQREIIIDFIHKNKKDHITADSIVDHLKNTGNPVGKATVYRFLDLLAKEGKVRKYGGVEGLSACYQYIDNDNCHMHYHLICNDCGKLFHIECTYLDKVGDHILNHHCFKMDNLKTVLYGTCEKCGAI
ncbi:MAG: hypothetical protein APF77_11980 [Clostridia bacterium BRH_c25]|nr:MAG: hypothetical protein APF77_11980 [Clostridia bacterium BRH_c25]